MPPLILLTCVKPLCFKNCAAVMLRFPLRQTMTNSFEGSSSFMRCVRRLRGILAAPGIYPSRNSFGSRTSMITAPACCFVFASSTVTSPTAGLLKKLRNTLSSSFSKDFPCVFYIPSRLTTQRCHNPFQTLLGFLGNRIEFLIANNAKHGLWICNFNATALSF